MERVKEKMEQANKQRKKLQKNSPVTTESSPANHNPQYIFALGGAAAGVAIAVIVWWATSDVTTDDNSMITPGSAEAIQISEIKKLSDNIAHLNERVELLTNTIANLDAKLMRVLVLTDDITDLENKLVTAGAKPVVPRKPETERVFMPTHTVKDRLNLRPSASLSTTPITVLKVGVQVEYISETDDWYYVNTQSHGKGWCSSDYLSPLL